MNRLLLNFLFFISLFLIQVDLHSQELWSLSRCLDYALENNIQLKQQEIIVLQQENNLLQSKLELLPSVNAAVGHNMNWGKSVNVQDLQISNTLTQSTSANASASLSLFGGMTKINTIKSAKKELLIAQKEKENLENNITIQITKAYLQVLLSIEIEKIAKENIKSVATQVERTKKLVDAGSQPYSSLADIEAQYANEKVQVVSAESNLRTNYLILKQLLDITNETEFIVMDFSLPDSLSMEQYDLKSVYASALSLPQVKVAELNLEKSKTDYKIQKGAAYPSLNFSAGYGTYFSDGVSGAFFSQFNDNRNPSMGFSLSIPIFNGWRSNTAIRNSRLNIKSAEFNLQKSRQDLYKEIQQAYNDAVTAYEKYQAYRQNRIAAKESFKNVENKFNVGILNGTDYVVAKNNLFKAESEFYQSQYQFILQLKILDYYRGVPIKL